VRLIASTSIRSHYEVALDGKEGNTVYGEYFVPQNVKRIPLVILVPGFGDESVAPCLNLARILCKQGVGALTLYLPVHSMSYPDSGEKDPTPSDAKEWLENYQRSVLKIRQIVEWASNNPEIDSQRIGIAGFSMGGMISSIAMAMETRINAGIFIIAGGNLEELSWGGAREALPVGHNCTREECRSVYSQYPAFIDGVKKNGLENVAPAKECFLFDPITFADLLRGRRVVMINADQDEIVSHEAVLEFWKACGEPPLKWLPATHISIYSHIQSISREIYDCLNSVPDE
jgi:hypothetical protein